MKVVTLVTNNGCTARNGTLVPGFFLALAAAPG